MLTTTCQDTWDDAFAAAILDPVRPVPFGIVDPHGKPAVRRFAVYRNNVVTSLVEALSTAFPAVRRLVGDAFFAAMARIYVARELPQSPVMLEYGATFPDFVRAFPPASDLPYLGDVAQLERAWTGAYYAAEAQAIDVAELGDILPARRSQTSLTLHPSLCLLRSSFPVVTLWEMNIDGGIPHAVDISRGGENALVLRPAAEVVVRRVNPGTVIFIAALAAGASMAEATVTVLATVPDFDLAEALHGLFAIGAVIGWTFNDHPHPIGSVAFA